MIRVYVFLAVLAVLGASLGGAYLKGRADGRAVAEAAAQEEVRELNEQLRLAEEAARAREQQRLAELEALEQSIEQLRREADEDPDAARPAIGTGSVRRINSVN